MSFSRVRFFERGVKYSVANSIARVSLKLCAGANFTLDVRLSRTTSYTPHEIVPWSVSSADDSVIHSLRMICVVRKTLVMALGLYLLKVSNLHLSRMIKRECFLGIQRKKLLTPNSLQPYPQVDSSVLSSLDVIYI